MICIFVGLPRKIKTKLSFVEHIIKEYKAQVIFSTTEEILKFKLPLGAKIIINENNEWYQNKFKEICNYPKSEYINMLQWLRLSDALRYIHINKMATENLKRVSIYRRKNWVEGNSQSPYFIEKCQEIKTIWHPKEV